MGGGGGRELEGEVVVGGGLRGGGARKIVRGEGDYRRDGGSRERGRGGGMVGQTKNKLLLLLLGVRRLHDQGSSGDE